MSDVKLFTYLSWIIVILLTSYGLYDEFYKQEPASDDYVYGVVSVGEDIPIAQESTQQEQIITLTPEECVLEEGQLSVIKYSYEVGHPHDLGYTLAAISLVESNAGKWKINIQDPGGGLYHVGLDKVLADKEWKRSSYNLNRAMQLLVDSDDYSAQLAIQELKNWKEKNSTNWLDVWASYHKGWSGPKMESGQQYAQNIRKTIQKIRSCGWVEPIIQS